METIDFEANHSKKEKIVAATIRNTDKLYSITVLNRSCLPATLILVGIHLFMSKCFPAWMAKDVDGTLVKQNILIAVIAVVILVVGIGLYIRMKRYIRSSISKNLLERHQERIHIQNDTMYYSFYKTYTTADEEKTYGGANGVNLVVNIPLSRISELTFDKATKKLTFRGQFFIQSQETFGFKGEGRGTKWEYEFVIYDYFSPSLMKTLVKHFKEQGNSNMAAQLLNENTDEY